jgi:hypothetical protein
MRYLLEFGIGLGTSFTAAFFGGIAAYNAVVWLGYPPFFTLMRMSQHHLAHYQQYIALVAGFYGVFSTVWALHFVGSQGWRRWCEIALGFVGVVICSGAAGGPLYYVHDYQAGYWPSQAIVEQQMLRAIPQGIILGVLVMALSFPLNVLALICGAFVTTHLPRFIKRV